MSNCNCQDAGQAATQSNLVAWVQPSGAGPLNPWYYAMSDSGDYPGIKITGARKNRRGTITPIHRRSGRNPRNLVRVGNRVGAPAANTITLEFSTRGCGGFQPSELIACQLDVYQQHICCGQAGSFETDWAKVEIFSGIDIESDEYSDGVSYNAEDDNDLFVRHTGEMQNKLTIYPLSLGEIAAAGGFDTGTTIRDVKYANREVCGLGACGTEQSCTDSWYAVTNEGRVIYKGSRTAAITSVAIAAYPANLFALVGLLGNRIYVTFVDTVGTQSGYYYATLDGSGNPGAFTRVNVATHTFNPLRLIEVGNALWMIGEDTAASTSRVYRINADTSYTLLLASTTASTALQNGAECGGDVILVGQDGLILVWNRCTGVFAAAPATPAASTIVAFGIRTTGEWWAGNGLGDVYFTLDGGENWTEKAFPFSGAGIVSNIVWANRNVGYLSHVLTAVTTVYATWDGGQTWSAVDPRIDNQPLLTVAGHQIAVPCCQNSVEQSNAFLLAGNTATVGTLWQASIQSCA